MEDNQENQKIPSMGNKEEDKDVFQQKPEANQFINKSECNSGCVDAESCGSGCSGSCSGSDTELKKYLPYIIGIALAVFLLMGIGIAVFGYGLDGGQLPQKVVGQVADNGVAANDFGNAEIGQLTLKVAIPCPGHAGIIIGDLKKIDGVMNVKFRLPNLFDVSYDISKTSQQEILDLKIFQTYPAKTANFI